MTYICLRDIEFRNVRVHRTNTLFRLWTKPIKNRTIPNIPYDCASNTLKQTVTHTHVWLDILNLMSNLTAYIVHVSCPRHIDYRIPCIIILYGGVTPQCGKLSTQTPHNVEFISMNTSYVLCGNFLNHHWVCCFMWVFQVVALTRVTHTWLQVRSVIKQTNILTYPHTIHGSCYRWHLYIIIYLEIPFFYPLPSCVLTP